MSYRNAYLKIFTHMRVNELFGLSMVSSNYVLTNHTYNMYKQALAFNNLEVDMPLYPSNQPTNQPKYVNQLTYQISVFV